MFINIVNNIIREYLNIKSRYERIKHNMLWCHKNLKSCDTTKNAFAYVIQSAISSYNAKESEYDAITNTLWQVLENKNHSLTRLW